MKTNSDLYVQLWISPITNGGLLSILSPENLHTFIGLSVYMNKTGHCNPSLKTLKNILGLRDIGSVSRRIKKLEQIKFEGNPMLTVKRTRKPNNNGSFIFDNNGYTLNQSITTIFAINIPTAIRRTEQIEKLEETRSKFANSFGFNAKRKR